jgi:hypothetical protein
MKKYIIVEGSSDVALIKYICLHRGITQNFNDFEKTLQEYKYNNLVIVDLTGQDKLLAFLKFLKPKEIKISSIGIIQDADNNFELSLEAMKHSVEEAKLNTDKIKYFLTPNHKDLGDLETLLLSTLDKKNIPQLKCFQEYKSCLSQKIDLNTKAMDKGELYAYTMFAKDGKKSYIPKDSFMYKPNKKYRDTGLWNLEKDEFKPLIDFVVDVFSSNKP